MSSPNSPTAVTATANDADRSRSTTTRRKKKKNAAANQLSKHSSSSSSSSSSPPFTNQRSQLQIASSNWKSQSQQRIYSTKLLRALRHVSVGGSAVREAADRALAVTARGRTRWSRAILTTRLKLSCLKRRSSSNSNKMRMKIVSSGRAHRSVRVSAAAIGNGRWRKTAARVSVYRVKAKNLPVLQKKARVLGRLVPGCRRESLPVILEEAKDYIPALEMQIRAMTDLINRLSSSPLHHNN